MSLLANVTFCITNVCVGSSSSKGSTTDAQGACSTSTTSSDCECPTVSFLERLRAPSASELGRERKIDANPAPPKGKRSTQNLRKFDPKSARPS